MGTLRTLVIIAPIDMSSAVPKPRQEATSSLFLENIIVSRIIAYVFQHFGF